MEQSPSWKGNRSSDTLEISRVLLNPKVKVKVNVKFTLEQATKA